jgi:hypothetical protein
LTELQTQFITLSHCSGGRQHGVPGSDEDA